MPVIFVVLFGYVFGSSITVPGGNYRSYLMSGLFARSPQSADTLSMVPGFLLGFISNVFVDPARMPSWLRVAADWNPMSAVVAAARQLFGTAQGSPPSGVWSLQHPVVTTLAMIAVLLAVLDPLSVRRYARMAR